MTGLVWKGLFLMYEGGGENERKQEEANPGSNKKKTHLIHWEHLEQLLCSLFEIFIMCVLRS